MSDECKDEASEKWSDEDFRSQVIKGLELAYGVSSENLYRPGVFKDDGSRASIILHERLLDPRSEVPELYELYEKAAQEVTHLVHRINSLEKKPQSERIQAET